MTPTLARMVARTSATTKSRSSGLPFPNSSARATTKGRLREHFQFNADIFGEADPSADARIDRVADRHVARLRSDRERLCHPPEQPECVEGFYQRGTRNSERGLILSTNMISIKSSTNSNVKSPRKAKSNLPRSVFDHGSEGIHFRRPTDRRIGVRAKESLRARSGRVRKGGLQRDSRTGLLHRRGV